MKVKDLIRILQDSNQNATVCVMAEGQRAEEPNGVTITPGRVVLF